MTISQFDGQNTAQCEHCGRRFLADKLPQHIERDHLRGSRVKGGAGENRQERMCTCRVCGVELPAKKLSSHLWDEHGIEVHLKTIPMVRTSEWKTSNVTHRAEGAQEGIAEHVPTRGDGTRAKQGRSVTCSTVTKCPKCQEIVSAERLPYHQMVAHGITPQYKPGGHIIDISHKVRRRRR